MTHEQLIATFSQALERKRPDLRESKQTWDRRAAEVSRFQVADDDFALAMLARHMKLAGRRVLDVSFGAGRHLEAFLRQGAAISGVEISPAMIGHAHERLNATGLPYDPQALVQSSWEALDLAARGWESAFDLVFLYMSPAVSSAAMLEKVLAASRGGVYLALYSFREDQLLTGLQQAFGLAPRRVSDASGGDIHAIFNLLYLWGYFPQLCFEQRCKTSHHPVDDVYERYFSWLSRDRNFGEDRRDELRSRLRASAADDRLTTTSRDIVGHLYLDKALRR